MDLFDDGDDANKYDRLLAVNFLDVKISMFKICARKKMCEFLFIQ